MDTIIILANLGRLKAFRMVDTPTRGPKLELVEDMNFTEAHGRFSEKVTDQSGRFPMTENAGPSMTSQQSSYEALPALAETERRLTRLLAREITMILDRERTEQWYFAANSEIHDAVMEGIPPALTERLMRDVHADLLKTPTPEVLSHFASPLK